MMLQKFIGVNFWKIFRISGRPFLDVLVLVIAEASSFEATPGQLSSLSGFRVAF